MNNKENNDYNISNIECERIYNNLSKLADLNEKIGRKENKGLFEDPDVREYNRLYQEYKNLNLDLPALITIMEYVNEDKKEWEEHVMEESDKMIEQRVKKIKKESGELEQSLKNLASAIEPYINKE